MFYCTYNDIPFQLPTVEVSALLDRYDWFDDLAEVLPYGQVWPGARLLKLGPSVPVRQALRR